MEAHPVPIHAPALILSVDWYLQQKVPLEQLSGDEHKCNICMEQFTDATDAEKPISLCCGHIFGSSCFKKWASSSQQAISPTCPMCRATLIPTTYFKSWECCATLLEKRPYFSSTQSQRRAGPFTLEDWKEAVAFVRVLLDIVMALVAHHRRDQIPASDLLIRSAHNLRCQMGHLGVLLKPTIELMGLTVPWGERGPQVITLLNLEYKASYHEALERLLDMGGMIDSKRSISTW